MPAARLLPRAVVLIGTLCAVLGAEVPARGDDRAASTVPASPSRADVRSPAKAKADSARRRPKASAPKKRGKKGISDGGDEPSTVVVSAPVAAKRTGGASDFAAPRGRSVPAPAPSVGLASWATLTAAPHPVSRHVLHCVWRT